MYDKSGDQQDKSLSDFKNIHDGAAKIILVLLHKSMLEYLVCGIHVKSGDQCWWGSCCAAQVELLSSCRRRNAITQAASRCVELDNLADF